MKMLLMLLQQTVVKHKQTMAVQTPLLTICNNTAPASMKRNNINIHTRNVSMHHIEGIFLFYPRLLVDVRDHSVLDYRAVLVPGAAVLLPARGVVASLTVDQEDEEVDGVEVWHNAAKAW